MAVIHRFIAAYLLLAGVAVAAYFLVYPFYAGEAGGDDAGDVWEVLNWFMAVSAVLLALVTYVRRGALAGDATTWERFVANGRFYLAAVLLLGFLSNWFADGWGHGETNPEPLIWVILNIGQPLLAISVALELWREPEPHRGE